MADKLKQTQPPGYLFSADMIAFHLQLPLGPEWHDRPEEARAGRCLCLLRQPIRHWQREPAYQGKNLLFLSGLNVDVSPRPGLSFPLTKFVPWASCARLRDGTRFMLEQTALFETLIGQPAENTDQMSYDAEIETMAAAEQIELPDS